MKDLNTIRKELKDIRYYYSRKSTLDKALEILPEQSEIMKLINLYNKIMRTASPKLYDIYYSLYIKNHTQESLSYELGYSEDYVYRANRKLLLFLQEEFNKGITEW